MTGLAREYGDGLYELAREEQLLPQLHQELLEIRDLLMQQPDFIRLLCSRAIERDARLRVVEETFGAQAHPYVRNFMKLLVEKERFDTFLDCCQWFHQRYNDEFNIVEANVISAVPLSEEECAALTKKLEEISGRTVCLISAVDPSVIGGIRVEMEGKRYDNTIQNRLGRLRFNLTHGL